MLYPTAWTVVRGVCIAKGIWKKNVLAGGDMGVHKSLKTLLHLNTEIGYENVEEFQEKWYPFAGLVYIHLLLQKLEEKGVL